MHGVVEDFLRGGGFEARILSSGEEALTLFKKKVADYKTLVTDIDRRRAPVGGEVARQVREVAAALLGGALAAVCLYP